MASLAILLCLYLFLVLIVFPIWVLTKFGDVTDQLKRLQTRLQEAQAEIKNLRNAALRAPAAAQPETSAAPAPAPVAAAVPPPPVIVSAPVPPPEPPKPVVVPPPAPVVPPVPVAAVTPAPVPVPPKPIAPPAPTPVVPVAPKPVYVPPPRQPSWLESINWEQFMGAKLFAWLGGLALFLGVAFFVKYSFEHDLIPPAVRAALGFLLGAGLVVGGLKVDRKRYAITAQTLIATGVVSLYAVTFACSSIYHFEAFGPVLTFALMSLITGTAFLLAVRLEAQVVAVLGILGGFLTPKLLSTGVDNPAGLFGYLALLNTGLIAVALHRRWFYLVPLGAAGTVIMMVGWANLFFAPEKVGTAMIVCAGFSALFLAAAEAGRRFGRTSPQLGQSAIAVLAVAFCFAWYFLGFPVIAARTVLFFSYVGVISLGVFFLAWREQLGGLVAGAAGITALLLVRWAGVGFSGDHAGLAMLVCLAFCALYFGVYLAARRLERVTPQVYWSAVALPAVALALGWHFLGFPSVSGHTGLFFGFVFLASLFVFALAWFEDMGRLVVGAAAATALLLVRWTSLTLEPSQVPVILTVCLVFCAVYFAVYLLARRLGRASLSILGAAAGLDFVALAFALFLIDHAAVGPLFGYILVVDGLLLALAWLDERVSRLHLLAGLTVFALLSVWTAGQLTDARLPWALAMYLAFAALHTVFPLLLERKNPAAKPTWWSQLFPPLTLVLMLLPIFRLPEVSFLIWPAILVVDLLAILLAVLSASLAAVGAVLVLTLLATGLSIFRIPVTAGLDLSLLLVLGGFAVFFFAASLWLVRRLGAKLPVASGKLNAVFGDPRAQLPAFASLLPFLLLIMACARLAVPDPSAIFGLGLLLVVLTLGLARLLALEWLPACALAGLAALELVWHNYNFDPRAAGGPLAWYLGFHAVFAAFPFLFRRTFARQTGPWAVAALSGLAQFWMTYDAIKAGWPGSADFLGAVPALFSLAPLASLVAILRLEGADNPKRLNQLAWFGAVALAFITLIFPIQFERQWLTVAWALEGAALLWLFHRVPHGGLRGVGVVLLGIAFARLALNPAVLGYHVRGETGLLNWYLYAYSVTAAALFTGARLMAPPRERVFGLNLPPVLNTLGTILAFLLLNIEIADYFTPPGARSLALQFDANLPRDMSYTIGWALFALGLLVAGIWKQTKAARYAAITLLSVALLKLFFHDLARLEALYRIGALFAVAIVAILASFAYQRFLPGNEKPVPPAP